VKAKGEDKVHLTSYQESDNCLSLLQFIVYYCRLLQLWKRINPVTNPNVYSYYPQVETIHKMQHQTNNTNKNLPKE
jgi:hypothetical protein